MYRGAVTPELGAAYLEYPERFVVEPDEYDEICFFEGSDINV